MPDLLTRATAEEAIEPTEIVDAVEPKFDAAVELDLGRRDGTAWRAFEVAGKDDDVRELRSKVDALVNRDHGGDYKKAFAHYDADHDGGINMAELTSLLAAAGVGKGWTRAAWGAEIIERLDGNHNETIQWAEFETVLTAKT